MGDRDVSGVVFRQLVISVTLLPEPRDSIGRVLRLFFGGVEVGCGHVGWTTRTDTQRRGCASCAPKTLAIPSQSATRARRRRLTAGIPVLQAGLFWSQKTQPRSWETHGLRSDHCIIIFVSISEVLPSVFPRFGLGVVYFHSEQIPPNSLPADGHFSTVE